MADRDADAAVAAWNDSHKPGIEVILTNDDREEERTRTRSIAWVVCGMPVVSVEGRSGGYSLYRIRAALEVDRV